MRFWQLACFAAAFAASSLCVTVFAKIPTDQSNLAVEVGVTEQPSSFFIPSATPATFEERFSVLLREQNSVVDNVSKKGARLEQEDFSFRDHSAGAISPQPHSSYSGLDPDAELPPDKKLADIVLDLLRNIPVGTPVEEIKRAADVFGLDFSFMMAVAKIEFDFDPNNTRVRISACSNSADPSSENMDPEILPARAITLLRQLTNWPLRRRSLNSMLIKCRLSAICI